MGTKGNLVLYLDKELVEKSKSLGFNLSKTFENHLKQLISQLTNSQSTQNHFQTQNRRNNMGLPGFEPGSIEPKGSRNIDWSKYKQYLESKYVKGYAKSLFAHSRKYCNWLENVNEIQLSRPTARNNIINGLTALSKYLGIYGSFKKRMKVHGIKRVKPDPMQSFMRIFNSKAHDGLGEWWRDANAVLKDNQKLYLRFMLLSGVRAMEGVKSFNLIADLGPKYTEEYYNRDTQFLEHFRYPKLFLRYSKNLYISAVPKELLDKISESSKIGYISIKKKLNRAGLGMRFKQLRSFYATRMREMGLLSEQIDLVQGRVGKSIFLQHYFKQDAKSLSNQILQLLPMIEDFLSC